MNTTTALILVGGVGLAAFIYMRSRNQQTQQIAAAQQYAASVGPGGLPTGGGIGGLAQRAFAQFKQDPLGIQNTKAALSTGVGIVRSGISSVGSTANSIVSSIKGIF